jgi:short-subunit dehydrogenase
MKTRTMNGKLVLVTGAASGIGRETALLCASRGADLAICDLDETRLATTATVARKSGADVMTQRVDVSDEASVQRFADAVHARHDAVDLLVNNAGIGLVAGLLDTTTDDWNQIIAVNVMGVVHGCRSFVPQMVACGRGHVVNVASAAGFMANPALLAYSATKFAVFGFSEALRGELRPHGIGVTAICPGVINTAIATSSPIRGENAAARRTKMAGLYERRGYGPERVAVRILSSVEHDRAVAPVAPEAHAMYALTRACPPLARRVAGRMAGVVK